MSLHVECGRAGNGHVFAGVHMPLEIAGSLNWSETIAAAGTSTNVVPPSSGNNDWVLTLTAEIDMWVALGTSPNAAVNPRHRFKAGVTRSFSAAPGTRVAWSAA